ncbi:cytochrome c [Donghicola sp. XS_ASV15]|uniref:c-type cytochrome n=1 Tax=Donghicola sp. XS_ASV15 TaxID=3241295 RepID=UPI0035143EC0
MYKLLLTTVTIGALATSALAQSATDTAKARRAFFTLIGYEMGTVGAMAQGKMDYDAEAASAAAADMVALTKYTMSDLFAPGTSSDDVPGETRALPAIWEDMSGFQAAGEDFTAALMELNAVAGDGLDALRPAVGKLGGTCKACHDEYRAKSF